MALTTSQERAIRFARRALDQVQAGDRPADIPGERAGDYWKGYLTETLRGLLEALEVAEPLDRSVWTARIAQMRAEEDAATCEMCGASGAAEPLDRSVWTALAAPGLARQWRAEAAATWSGEGFPRNDGEVRRQERAKVLRDCAHELEAAAPHIAAVPRPLPSGHPPAPPPTLICAQCLHLMCRHCGGCECPDFAGPCRGTRTGGPR